MSVIQAARPASRRAVLLEEVRLIIRRHWWEYLAIALVVTAYFGWPRFLIPAISASLTHVSLEAGSPWGFGGGPILTPLVYFLVGMYAALTLWRDYPPDRRSHLYERPIDKTWLNLLRVGIGAAGLGAALLLGLEGTILVWSWGPVNVDQAGFVLGVLPPWNWLIWIVAVLNVYLVGSIIALLSRAPARGVMLVLLGISVLWGLAAYVPSGIWRVPLIPLLPPDGLLGGLGITIWDAVGDDLEPALAAPLMWSLILSAFTWLAARRAAGRPV